MSEISSSPMLPYLWTPSKQDWTGYVDDPAPQSVLLKQMSRGQITPRDLDIAEALIQHRFFTADQIGRLFFDTGLARMFKRLASLIDYGLLCRFTWTDTNHRMVYALDTGGYRLLKAVRQIQVPWNFDRNIKPMDFVLRSLITNELYIALAALPQLTSYACEPLIPIDRDVNLIPGAHFILSNGSEDRHFFVEAVRSCPQWDAALEKKLHYYKLFLDAGAWKSWQRPPYLLMVCESDEGCVQADKLLHQRCPGLEVFYTTDARLADQELTKAFAQMQRGTLQNIVANIFTPLAAV